VRRSGLGRAHTRPAELYYAQYGAAAASPGARGKVRPRVRQAPVRRLRRALLPLTPLLLQAAPARGKLDAKAVDTAFLKYKAPDAESIQADGVMRLCEDLKVDPGDVSVLVLAYHFKAERMCEFSKAEWVQGMGALGVDSVEKLAGKMASLRASLADEATFRGVYTYAFGFGLEKGAKAMVADTAQALWQLLLPGRWAAAEAWLSYVAGVKGLKAVSKDTWMQLLEFSRKIKADFSDYDEDGAWPTLIDDFVEQARGTGEKGGD